MGHSQDAGRLTEFFEHLTSFGSELGTAHGQGASDPSIFLLGVVGLV